MVSFTDIPFLNSHNPYFLIKNGLKFLKEKALKMIPKYGRTAAQIWPETVRAVKIIIIFELALHFE